MARKSGLGRGLGLLVGEADAETAGMRADSSLPLNQIHPNKDQPRRAFDEAELDELADSIRQNGILQPLLVRKREKGYEIVAGERRYQAARRAGLSEVPVIIREISDEDVFKLALIENLQRSAHQGQGPYPGGAGTGPLQVALCDHKHPQAPRPARGGAGDGGERQTNRRSRSCHSFRCL